jgi:uncharacterized membrane protein
MTIVVTRIEKKAESLTFGQILADKMAGFGGSWKFIILLIVLWMLGNIYSRHNKGFYPLFYGVSQLFRPQLL